MFNNESIQASKSPVDITPLPVEELEVRLVVWKTKNFQMMDWEGTSDIFIRAYFDSKADQQTDTHWRSQNGVGSFNYRLKFPIKSQGDDADYVMTLQGWDKDVLASNDLIGETQIDLKSLVDDALVKKDRMILQKNYFDNWMKEQLQNSETAKVADEMTFDDDDKDRFWLPIRRHNKEQDVYVQSGEILCSITVIPKVQAEKLPQGEARQEPNSDPFCPEPEGRIKLSINPLEMLEQIIPKSMWNKIMKYSIAAACCTLLIFMAPMILSNIIAKIFTG